ncbi:MAG: hypothetical protein AAGD04_03675 [Pseudomonadota bacterium]
MAKARWHILRSEDALTVSRVLPVRFDISAEAVFPLVHPLRLATQIRQDMWRLLQNLRGFAPAVEVVSEGGSLRVRAGGAVMGAVPGTAQMALEGLLNAAPNRARWCAYARLRRSGP